MKLHFCSVSVAVILVASLLPVRVCAQSNSFRLTLEQSTNGLGSWDSIQVVDIVTVSSNAFYRMKIEPQTMVTVQGGSLPTNSAYANSTVATFRIGRYEVTWTEWQQVRSWAVTNGYTDLAGVGLGSAGNHPVRGVNFYNALKWCNARSEKEGLAPVYEFSGAIYRTGENFPSSNANANGYRLPTITEWEWAASGGVRSQGYDYSGSNDLSTVAWANSSDPEPKPVGTKAANELGIYDMCGNVWEWAYLPFKAHKGGCWIDGYWSVWFNVRAQSSGDPGHGPEYFGLRVARNAL